MKKYLAIISFMFISIAYGFGQSCLPDGIEFHYQYEVDSFPINYPDCHHIEGGVKIYGNQITYLDSLYNIKTIGGDLYIPAANGLTSFFGLDSLSFIGGDFRVFNSNSFTSFEGLSNLQLVGGDIVIFSIENLESFEGLENLTQSNGDMTIKSNPNIIDLSGFEALQSIDGDFIVYNNQNLISFNGLSSLETINGTFEINTNHSLIDFTGFGNFQNVNNKLIIHNNSNLQSLLGVDSLQNVEQDIQITYNETLQYTNALSGLNCFGDTILIDHNEMLLDYTRIGNMDSFEGKLIISNNDSFVSFSGFENVTSFPGELLVINNNSLVNFAGLEDLQQIHRLLVEDNSSLIDFSHINSLAEINNLYVHNNESFTSFSGLENIHHITWFSVSGNNSLQNFQGLSNLTTVYSFGVHYNDGLLNFEGLENLEEVTEMFYVEDNSSLVNFIGLENLSTIQKHFFVRENSALEDFTGLYSLDSIKQVFQFKYNDNVKNVNGLNNVVYIAHMDIGGNSSLKSLEGFEGLTYFEGHIQYNDSLQNLQGLNNVIVGGGFYITGNDQLADLSGLDNLQEIENSFSLYDNLNLESISALENLTSIGNDITICENDSLQSLAGLENCVNFSGEIRICENESLSDIEGIKNFSTDSISKVNIEDNPNLSECAVECICSSIANNADVTIENNKLGCNSIEEVAENCDIDVSQPWVQLGESLNGEGSNEKYGTSVSINSDGTIIAVGGIRHCIENFNCPGYVKIFKDIEGNWIQMGEDIIGGETYDQFGNSVSLSANGLVLAIGAFHSSVNGNNSGKVTVFKFENNSWIQIGNSMDGVANSLFGYSIDLSADGNVVAIGAVGSSENGNSSGKVQVYHYEFGEWVKMGDDLLGVFAEDYFGCSVSVNNDGTVLSVGAINSDFSGNNSGTAYLYDFVEGSWILKASFYGENSWDYFGTSVDLNYIGDRLAVGAVIYGLGNGINGYVKVFEKVANVWTQVGGNIEGEDDEDSFGESVSIDSLGYTVAIGGPGNDAQGSNAGHLRVYNFIDENWEILGRDIDYQYENSGFGYSVCVDSQGITVVGGAPCSDQNGESSGQVEVFTLKPVISQEPSDVNNACPYQFEDISISAGGIIDFQWQKSIDNISWNNIFDDEFFQGTNTSTLSVFIDSLTAENYYRAVISNEYGYLESNPAQIFIDTIKPNLLILDNVEVEADSTNSFTVNNSDYDPISSSDNCAIESVINDYSNTSTLAGSTFPEGDNIVVWIAKDYAGNETVEYYHFIVHKHIGVIENDNNKLAIYPNPAKDKIKIDFDHFQDINKIIINDIHGNEIDLRIEVNNNMTFDISPLSRGIYFVKIQTEKGLYVGKFMKQ